MLAWAIRTLTFVGKKIVTFKNNLLFVDFKANQVLRLLLPRYLVKIEICFLKSLYSSYNIEIIDCGESENIDRKTWKVGEIKHLRPVLKARYFVLLFQELSRTKTISELSMWNVKNNGEYKDVVERRRGFRVKYIGFN